MIEPKLMDTAELEVYKTSRRMLEYDTGDIDALLAHIAALTPVVEAAVARRELEKQLLTPTLVNGLIIAAFQDSSDELHAAVDALEKAREAGK